MTSVIAALLPVFLLIVLGFVLRRYLLKEETHWIGLERLVYFVLFPSLLIETLSKANLSSVPIGGVGGALLLAVLTVAALCLLLRPILQSRFGIDGPAFTSIFQASIRWQTFVALAVANNLYGDRGVALASVAMVAMIPLLNVLSVTVLARYARPHRLSFPELLSTIARNPLIWACVVGLGLNLSGLPIPPIAHDFIDALGRSALAVGLLVVGAALQMDDLMQPRAPALVTMVLKLMLMPTIAITYGIVFGLSGINLAVVACCASVPAASNAYVLAKQMGGDAPLLAQVLTLQTIVAVVTMPVVIATVT